MRAWQPIETAPSGVVIEVRNGLGTLQHELLAVRGYKGDDTLFTSVFTPRGTLPFPSGCMVCPTEWRMPMEGDAWLR